MNMDYWMKILYLQALALDTWVRDHRDNKWHHVAIIFNDAETFDMWVDGAEVK